MCGRVLSSRYRSKFAASKSWQIRVMCVKAVTLYTIKEVSYGQTQRFIKSTIEEWVKDFSKEMPIVRTSLQYMGNEIFIQDKRVCVQPLRSRLEAIKKLQPPTTV